jgi:hypothetical protein
MTGNFFSDLSSDWWVSVFIPKYFWWNLFCGYKKNTDILCMYYPLDNIYVICWSHTDTIS